MSIQQPTEPDEDPFSEELLRPVLDFMTRNNYERVDLTIERTHSESRTTVLEHLGDVTCDATPEDSGLNAAFIVVQDLR